MGGPRYSISTKNDRFFAIAFYLIVTLVDISNANLNVYLNQYESRRLFGVAAEVYYVRDGIANEYALGYIVPVAAQIETLHFTWQSLAGRPLPYVINFDVSNDVALGSPQMNISYIGHVPTIVQTFSIALPCTGLIAAEVKVSINVNITLNRATNNVTALHFRRKKICLKSDTYRISQANHVIVDTAPALISSATIFYIAVGCAFALIATVTIFVTAFYVRNKKVRRHNDNIVNGDSRNHSVIGVNGANGTGVTGTGQTQTTFLSAMTPLPQNLFTGTSPFSCKSGSSYSSFRRVPTYALTDEQSKDLQERIAELTIQRCRVRLRSVMLEGTFGRVYHGSYTDEDSPEEQVLVKTVADHASQVQISLLLQEGMTMYGMNHKNILTILGVSIEDHTAPFLIYPYKGYTNLKRFLQKCKLCPEGVAHTLTTQEVVDMALQVVQGMQYLHDKMLKHKDLAARNCVVDEKLRVQITDNALSRDLFPSDYHCLGDNENRPIKWLAIESLQYNLFLFQSDVWSFGVFLWELMTLAQQPYVEIDPFEMEAYLRDGYRLAQPVNCPDELFAVMAYCWAMRTEERPSFKQLQVCLQEFYAQLTKYV